MNQGRIIITGAGGFGREVASWCLDSFGYKTNLAFIDDTKTGFISLGAHKFPVISKLNAYMRKPEDKLLMGLADPYAKNRIADDFKKRDIQFSTFIHRSVICSPGAKIGEGTVVCPNCVLSDNVNLGKFITLNLCCTVGHDVDLGDYNTLSSHVDIMGGCKVGKFVFWGSGSRIIPEKVVGNGCKIGAGALVMHNISELKTIYCTPSKTL